MFNYGCAGATNWLQIPLAEDVFLWKYLYACLFECMGIQVHMLTLFCCFSLPAFIGSAWAYCVISEMKKTSSHADVVLSQHFHTTAGLSSSFDHGKY